jgi:hypothetical protein
MALATTHQVFFFAVFVGRADFLGDAVGLAFLAGAFLAGSLPFVAAIFLAGPFEGLAAGVTLRSGVRAAGCFFFVVFFGVSGFTGRASCGGGRTGRAFACFAFHFTLSSGEALFVFFAIWDPAGATALLLAVAVTFALFFFA